MVRWLFACILIGAVMSGVAQAEPQTPAAFTQQVAHGIQKALPSSTVTVTRELELAVKTAGGTTASLSLVNSFHDYARDPKLLDAIVVQYVAFLTRPKSPAAVPAKLDRSRIVPVIKARQ